MLPGREFTSLVDISAENTFDQHNLHNLKHKMDVDDPLESAPPAPTYTRGRRRNTSSNVARRNSGTRTPIKPVQRHAANARERSRMRVLSKAFSRLKTSLPWVPPDTKLSKLDTLRLASSYIQHLRRILDDDSLDGRLIHPLNLVRIG